MGACSIMCWDDGNGGHWVMLVVVVYGLITRPIYYMSLLYRLGNEENACSYNSK